MIAVTGGAGFIGSWLVEKLLEQGYEVLVIDNLSSGTRENVPEKAELVVKDIREVSDRDLEGVNAVFHFAADPDVRKSVSEPRKSFEVNVIGSFNVLEAAREAGVKSFVFASSGGTVYGEVNRAVDEEFRLRPISPYGASKAAFEAYLSAYAHSYGMNCISLRFGNIIGPRLNHGVIWDFYWKLRKNPEKLVILGNGEQEKSYLYVEDAVNASLLAWERARGFEVFNIAHEKTLKVKEIAEIVSKELGVKPEFEFTGGVRGWIGDVPKFKLDVGKIKTLGWKPKVEPSGAVKLTVRWLVERFGGIK